MSTACALAGVKQERKANCAKKDIALKLAVLALALLLIMSSALAVFEYNEALSFQNEISQRDSTIHDRDTLITQLDTALNLAQSRLNLKLPNGSRYLTTLPDPNHEGNPTKIFLVSTAAGYSYLPPYPFKTPWFNGTSGGYFSSQRVFELTDNRSLTLSFWGWTFDAGGLNAGKYEYGIGTGEPVLMIGVTVRNDYAPADGGNGANPNAPISTNPYTNRSSSWIVLTAKFYRHDDSIIQVADANITQSPTAIGGHKFALGSGETAQVVFYFSPPSQDVDHYKIYVSYLSGYW